MLEAPRVKLPETAVTDFQAAWRTRDPTRLPAGVPRWLFLDWLTGQGFLLHGSPRGDLTRFEPRASHDLSGDEFSSRTGVFASSDALWATMYALTDRARIRRMVNCAMQVQDASRPGGWSRMKYFLSYAPRAAAPADARDLLTPGFVYVLPPVGFEPMPPYDWPGLGRVREAQWVNPQATSPLWCVPVRPEDFPLPVRVHDAQVVDARCAADPWAFPWLD